MSAEPEYIDLISGKPLEPWAEQVMRDRHATRQSDAPTPRMIAAGERALVGMSEKHWGRAEAVWRAMTAALETQPEASRFPASEPQALSEERAREVLADEIAGVDSGKPADLEWRNWLLAAPNRLDRMSLNAHTSIRAMIRFATETQKGSG